MCGKSTYFFLKTVCKIDQSTFPRMNFPIHASMLLLAFSANYSANKFAAKGLRPPCRLNRLLPLPLITFHPPGRFRGGTPSAAILIAECYGMGK
jgi:hypothetical protein